MKYWLVGKVSPFFNLALVCVLVGCALTGCGGSGGSPKAFEGGGSDGTAAMGTRTQQIEGIVEDGEGNASPGVEVGLSCATGSGITDQEGHFSILAEDCGPELMFSFILDGVQIFVSAQNPGGENLNVLAMANFEIGIIEVDVQNGSDAAVAPNDDPVSEDDSDSAESKKPTKPSAAPTAPPTIPNISVPTSFNPPPPDVVGSQDDFGKEDLDKPSESEGSQSIAVTAPDSGGSNNDGISASSGTGGGASSPGASSTGGKPGVGVTSTSGSR